MLSTDVLPSAGGKSIKPQLGSVLPQSQKRIYERASYQGVIYGSVSFSGQAPRRIEIDMSADSVCAKINRQPLSQEIIVTDGKLANVFIYVRSASALEEFEFKTPAQSATLAHTKCQYSPRVLGLQVGQPLNIINGDRTAHNTNMQPRINSLWNMSQGPGAEPLARQFDRAETFIPVKCNQHPWEKAFIGVFAHPFYTTSDRSGAYRIEGLPPGRYTLVAWHEKFGEQEFEVTIADGEKKQRNFEMRRDAP